MLYDQKGWKKMFSATSVMPTSSCVMGTSHRGLSGIPLPSWLPLLSPGISSGSKCHSCKNIKGSGSAVWTAFQGEQGWFLEKDGEELDEMEPETFSST